MLVSTSVDPVAKIKVLGVGGGGCNAINTMITDYDIQGVDFMAFNTDAQSLKLSQAPITLQLGEELTRGLGVGGNAELGAQAAEESLDKIQEMLEGANMVFVTAGMGGRTGTGAAPIIAGVAKNMGALTVAVVTKPFAFEGKPRQNNAEKGIKELEQFVDTLVVIPNDRLLKVVGKGTSLMDAFKVCDDVLRQGIQGISDLISQPSLINLDFADVEVIMRNKGIAHMGIGIAGGEGRAIEAARQAIASPLLETSIDGAKSVLINISGDSSIGLMEIEEAATLIAQAADPDANIIFGASIDEDLNDQARITVIATGFTKAAQQARSRQLSPTREEAQRNSEQPYAAQTFAASANRINRPSYFGDDASSRDRNPSYGGNYNPPSYTPNNSDVDEDDLDVPPFLRRRR